MSSRRLFTLPLVCLLIVSFLAGSAGASSYVWCVSADGEHSALEFAPTGDCSQDDCAPAPDGVTAAALEADPDGCGPCLDISSAHQWNVSRCRQDELPVDIPAAFFPGVAQVFIPLPERILDTHRFADRPPRVPDSIRHHRTIVLLI